MHGGKDGCSGATRVLARRGAASGAAVLRAPEHHHAIGAYLAGSSYHALGACEVGSRIG